MGLTATSRWRLADVSIGKLQLVLASVEDALHGQDISQRAEMTFQ